MAGKKEQVLEIGKHTRFTSENQPDNRGRKPGIPNTATRLQKFLSLIVYMENPLNGQVEAFTILEQMDLIQITKALTGDIAAYREILDRFEGKPKLYSEFTGPEEGYVQVMTTGMTEDQERQVVALLAEMKITD
jgi:hypothetical protein